MLVLSTAVYSGQRWWERGSKLVHPSELSLELSDGCSTSWQLGSGSGKSQKEGGEGCGVFSE